MSPSGTKPSTGKVLIHPNRLVSGLRAIRRFKDEDEEGEHLVVGSPPVPQTLDPPSLPRARGSLNANPGSVALPRHSPRMVQQLLQSLPSPYPLLGLHDVKLTGKHPIAAGGFADIFEATYDGRRVVLKSYRQYISFDIAQVVTRFRSEVHICRLLPPTDALLVGVYSTETHPFGLVYEYMDNLDLKQYLRNEPNIGRLNLVTELARRVKRMHAVGITHGDLRTVNILVDKEGVPYISGLGSARAAPRSTSWVAEGTSFSVTDNPTKACDMYAFGVAAYEVLTGKPVFGEMTEIAATHLMSSGSRPRRPNQREASKVVWQVIQSCWDPLVSKRPRIDEVVTLLESELGRVTTVTTGV